MLTFENRYFWVCEGCVHAHGHGKRGYSKLCAGWRVKLTSRCERVGCGHVVCVGCWERGREETGLVCCGCLGVSMGVRGLSGSGKANFDEGKEVEVIELELGAAVPGQAGQNPRMEGD